MSFVNNAANIKIILFCKTVIFNTVSNKYCNSKYPDLTLFVSSMSSQLQAELSLLLVKVRSE